MQFIEHASLHDLHVDWRKLGHTPQPCDWKLAG